MTQQTSPPKAPARAPLPDAWWELSLSARRWIAAGVFVVLLAGIAALVWWLWPSTDSESSGNTTTTIEPTAEATEFYADLTPQRIATWDALAECESESDWYRATGNGYYGGLQFSQTSWLGVGGQGGPHENSRQDQIMRAELLYDEQGWSAWPNCSAQLGLQ